MVRKGRIELPSTDYQSGALPLSYMRIMATRTGIEPVVSCVTGKRLNHSTNEPNCLEEHTGVSILLFKLHRENLCIHQNRLVGAAGLEHARSKDHKILIGEDSGFAPSVLLIYAFALSSVSGVYQFRHAPTIFGASGESRTPDAQIFNLALYQLSYRGIKTFDARSRTGLVH